MRIEIPKNKEAEQAVLGSILISNKSIYKIKITEDDFFFETHRKIFAIIREMIESGKAADLVTLNQHLLKNGGTESVGGISYVSSLLDAVPTASNIKHYASIVSDCSVKRQLLAMARELADNINNKNSGDLVAMAEESLYRLNISGMDKHAFKDFRNVLMRAFDEIERLHESGNTITGLPTGVDALDKILGGLNKTDLIILAGRPGMGKTAVAGSISGKLCRQGKCVVIYSVEMSDTQLCKRLISSTARVNGKKFRVGGMSASDFSRVTMAMGEMEDYKLYINDSPDVTLDDVRSSMMAITARHDVDLVIVDYLQLMSLKRGRANMTREREVSGLSRGLKKIAKHFNVPVIALSQLNRGCESRENKRPLLSDLRESGGLEQDGDVIMFLYRDVIYNEDTEKPEEMEILVRKNRHGPCRIVRARFIEEYSRLENWEG